MVAVNQGTESADGKLAVETRDKHHSACILLYGTPMNHLLSSLTQDIVQPEELLTQPRTDRLFIEARLGADPDEEYQNYLDNHIHGAVYAQIREVFASPPTSTSGSLPLPALSELQRTLRHWQVGPETEIIVYGPSPALAARAWWTLRWAGLSKVRLLDGGLRAWTSAGGPVAQGTFVPAKRRSAEELVLQADSLPQIQVSEMEQLPESVVLIDARDESAYLAGHIPLARNLPASELWTPSGALRTVDEVRGLFESVGVTENADVVVYCGGGVLSALEVLLLQALGVQPRLYVGSWSEWGRSPARIARSAITRVV